MPAGVMNHARSPVPSLPLPVQAASPADPGCAAFPYTRPGFSDYATLGFDAVEALNATKPGAIQMVRNTTHIPAVVSSDAHADPMLGTAWTGVMAQGPAEDILEAVRHGKCVPEGSPFPPGEILHFYYLYLRHRVFPPPAGREPHCPGGHQGYEKSPGTPRISQHDDHTSERKVNSIHTTLVTNTRWIGIDLNTTGFAVVAADPTSGHVLKLGKRPAGTQTSQTKDCTKLFREGKMWKLKKIKTREQKKFRTALVVIARQVVSFAESASAGIKFEKLFSHHAALRKNRTREYEFSFQNSSFPHLLRLVERRAAARGIPVAYVDPANTSKTCSMCGCTGHRVRKRFECPACGAVIHADINAALNIAATSRCPGRAEADRVKNIRKKMRREARQEQDSTGRPISPLTIPGIPADFFLPGRGIQAALGAVSGNEYPAKIPGARS